jgi:hypothetical protein
MKYGKFVSYSEYDSGTICQEKKKTGRVVRFLEVINISFINPVDLADDSNISMRSEGVETSLIIKTSRLF